MTTIKLEESNCFVSAVQFRGFNNASRVFSECESLKKKKPHLFVEYNSDPFGISLCDTPPKGFTQFISTFSNHMAVKGVLKGIEQAHWEVHKTKKFWHMLEGEGLTEA